MGRRITAQEAHRRMELGDAFILLDVRTLREFNQCRIDGAICIPVEELADRAEKELPDKDAQILIYCQIGARADSAAKYLISMDYTNVSSFGGIVGWQYGTVKG